MEGNNQEITKVEEINFTRIATILLRGKWIIISILLACLLGDFIYLRYTIPKYKASCSINIEADPDQSLFFSNNNNKIQRIDFPDIINSRGIIETTVRELNLFVTYYQEGNVVSSELYKRSPFIVKYDSSTFLLYNTSIIVDFIDENTFKLFVESDPKNPITCSFYKKCNFKGSEFVIERGQIKQKLSGHQFRFKVNTVEQMINWMKQNFSLSWFGKTGTGYVVIFTDPVSERAIDCANKVCEVYLSEELDIKRLSAKQTVDYIDEQLNVIKSNLNQSEQKLSNYELKYNEVQIQARKEQINNELKELNLEIVQIDAKRKILDGLYKYMVEKFSVNPEDSIVFAPNIENVFSQILTASILKLNELLSTKSKLLSKHTHNSPIIQQLNVELVELQQLIYENIQVNYAQIADRKTFIQNRIRLLEQSIFNFPTADQRNISDAKREFTINEGIYNLLLQKRTESSISMAATVSKSRILDRAEVSNVELVSPLQARTIGLSISAGFVASLIIVILRELLRKNISYKSEIEDRLSIPVVGTIIRSSKNNQSTLSVLIDTRSALTESFRHLRSNVFSIIREPKQGYCISTTSTISGEGKSFISINLAALASNTGRKVLLIDFDLRKPRLHLYFNIKNDIGISSVLLGEQTRDAVIKSTGFQNFDIITAGSLPPNPAEVIANEKLKDIINYYREKYDYIFFDTSPVGLVTDALSLLKMSDLSLYVIRSDYSKKTFLNNIETIQNENQLKNLYIVFNYVDMEHEGYGYGYGYNYGYGYGYYIDSDHRPWWKKIIKSK